MRVSGPEVKPERGCSGFVGPIGFLGMGEGGRLEIGHRGEWYRGARFGASGSLVP